MERSKGGEGEKKMKRNNEIGGLKERKELLEKAKHKDHPWTREF